MLACDRGGRRREEEEGERVGNQRIKFCIERKNAFVRGGKGRPRLATALHRRERPEGLSDQLMWDCLPTKITLEGVDANKP